MVVSCLETKLNLYYIEIWNRGDYMIAVLLAILKICLGLVGVMVCFQVIASIMEDDYL